MGFYHGSRRRGLSSEDVGPNITPREYIVRFADGKAVEHWGVTDAMAMMEQLGVSATPAG